MRVSRFLMLWLATSAALAAERPDEKQINENAIALVQAFLNLPDSYIGGVSKEDRGAFLSLVSHYGDIDFARGYFKLAGDGARAEESPRSRAFSMKLYPREEKRPLCVIAPASYSIRPKPPISVISFGQYWRWTDATKEYLPKDLDLNQEWYVRLSRSSNDIMAGLKVKYKISDGREFYSYGPMKGKLVWENERFSFEPFDAPKFFQSAILGVPPRFLADIPLDQRKKFWRLLEGDPERLDPANGWLHYYSDGANISSTSMIWAKLLQRSQGEPYFFVHMAKPFADGKPPRKNQTYILKKEGSEWIDITKNALPRKLDPSDHYRTRRDSIIEVGNWMEFDRADGRGKAWKFGTRNLDLLWRNDWLQTRKAQSDTFTKN